MVDIVEVRIFDLKEKCDILSLVGRAKALVILSAYGDTSKDWLQKKIFYIKDLFLLSYLELWDALLITHHESDHFFDEKAVLVFQKKDNRFQMISKDSSNLRNPQIDETHYKRQYRRVVKNLNL